MLHLNLEPSRPTPPSAPSESHPQDHEEDAEGGETDGPDVLAPLDPEQAHGLCFDLLLLNGLLSHAALPRTSHKQQHRHQRHDRLDRPG